MQLFRAADDRFVPVTLVLETRAELDGLYGSLQVSQRDQFEEDGYSLDDIGAAFDASFRLLDTFDQFYKDEGMDD